MKYRKHIAALAAALLVLSLLVLPAGATSYDKEFSVPAGRSFIMTEEDMSFTGNELGVVIVSTPDKGYLKLGLSYLRPGSVVMKDELSKLTFIPASDGVYQTEFAYVTVYDDKSTSSVRRLRVTMTSDALQKPTVDKLYLETKKNIAVQAAWSGKSAYGSGLTYQLVAKPKKGDVTFDESDPTSFVYTPYDNKTGSDSFTYRAVDKFGSLSEPAKVTVKIKNDASVYYEDMQGNIRHLQAITLADNGIFMGDELGGLHFFYPERTVTRGEYLVMALRAAGLDARMTPVSTTSFADDADISLWLKPYVKFALDNGMLHGRKSEKGLVFDENQPITKEEARLLNGAILQHYPVYVMSASDNKALLTREDAAVILSGLLVERNKDKSGSLLDWAVR